MNSVIEIVPDVLDGERVDRVVAICTEASRAEVRTLINEAKVLLDGVVVTKPSTRVARGQTLSISWSADDRDRRPKPDATVAFAIVYEDADLLVVDKPAGVVVHPGAGHRDDTLVSGLLARYPEIASVGVPDRPGIVHRLDKDTSGLLMVARTPEAHVALSRALAGHDVARTYLALACGHVEADSGVIDAPIGRSPRQPVLMAVVAGGRPAVTRYAVERRYTSPIDVTLLRCDLETGRTHQIRVHLQAIGHPVLGDARYGGKRSGVAVHRPFLHAARLVLAHPVTGETLDISSPLPADLAAVLASFG